MPSHDAYAEPEGNRTFTVVLLALLILAVIGALFGFVLGRRAGQGIDNPESRAGDGKSAGPSAVVTTQGAPKAVNCPDFIQTGVRNRDGKASTPVTLVLYVRTEKAEAWICREADGSGLWYQGHDKRKNYYKDGEIPVEGDNGLLLNNVSPFGSGYRGYNSSNTSYVVTKEALTVGNNPQKVLEYQP